MKVVRTLDVALQQPAVLQDETQSLTQRLSFSPNQEIPFVPPMISVLRGIEPEVVYAGYDNTKPETPSSLLTSLNHLCERQLLCVVKWSKLLPGNRGFCCSEFLLSKYVIRQAVKREDCLFIVCMLLNS